MTAPVPEPGTAPRVVGILVAIAAMGAMVLLIGRALTEPDEPRYPAVEPRTAPVAPGAGQARPIASEADVFRLWPDEFAVPPDAEPREGAQRRTLAIYRSLRAFPGAPPRIPHGLTQDEFRNARCNTCHERGGYSPRFGAYAPVAPHPEFRDCLQCHVADGNLVGIGFPDPTPGAVCLQCHTLEVTTPRFALVDWPAPTWPEPNQRALDEAPPWIPHDLHLRGHCLACHGGPAAVAEIRTSHPERPNCRQCHVPGPSTGGEFTRPVDTGPVLNGGGP